jgi:hypothetical protein
MLPSDKKLASLFFFFGFSFLKEFETLLMFSGAEILTHSLGQRKGNLERLTVYCKLYYV